MAATKEATYDEQFREAVGEDATANFESGGNYAGSNPTENAGSESLYAAGGTNMARETASVADDEDEEEDDDLEDDDDLDEDDEEDEDDLEDDEEDDEDLDEDEDDEDDDDDLDDDEDEDDEDEDATLKADPSDSIRGRATGAANAVARRRI